MEDLKEALAPVLGAQLDKDSILEISRMAEKFTAPKLMEICVDYIVSNITDPGEIFAGMPQIANLCWKKQLKKLEIANVLDMHLPSVSVTYLPPDCEAVCHDLANTERRRLP